MIREVPAEIPEPRHNGAKFSRRNHYFTLANETPNDFLMIPCKSNYSAKLLAKGLARLNVDKYNNAYEVIKREEVVYLKRKKVDVQK